MGTVPDEDALTSHGFLCLLPAEITERGQEPRPAMVRWVDRLLAVTVDTLQRAPSRAAFVIVAYHRPDVDVNSHAAAGWAGQAA